MSGELSRVLVPWGGRCPHNQSHLWPGAGYAQMFPALPRHPRSCMSEPSPHHVKQMGPALGSEPHSK